MEAHQVGPNYNRSAIVVARLSHWPAWSLHCAQQDERIRRIDTVLKLPSADIAK